VEQKAGWPASSANATDAQYTVTYEGGSSTVTVNQRVNGGQWNLLGTFPFNASGTGYKVDLADSSASGKVVADAIYYVRDSAAVDSFTWTPDIQSAGDYQLYARWTASSANSGAAQYTVVHGGGTSLVTVSQKQNGGQWNLLGTYSFAPAAGHQVTLTASADGNVIADAIKLVGTGPAPADLVYLHSDPIGLPQKITNATQAIVWDRVQDPFGRQVSLTNSGGIDTPLRFPGQQADPDTGFAYNYFRDYDPTLGRYIQADPIGLAGGINRYVYVGGNPVSGIDPAGLDPDSSSSRSYLGPYTSWAPGNTPFDQAARRNFANWLYNLINPPHPEPWMYEQACHAESSMLDNLFNGASSSGDDVEECKKKCDAALQIQVDLCKMLKDPGSRELCYERANQIYSECLRNCK
jgi:RHS repeat-associated protein